MQLLGHSSVVSSGTDNSLGALLEHRHLSLSVRYIHMVVHSLIIQQAFTQYLSLCLVLGITVNNRHNPCPHEAHSQVIHKEACSQTKSGLIQQISSYVRVNSHFAGAVTRRGIRDRMVAAQFSGQRVFGQSRTTAVRYSTETEARTKLLGDVGMLKAVVVLNSGPVSGVRSLRYYLAAGSKMALLARSSFPSQRAGFCQVQLS